MNFSKSRGFVTVRTRILTFYLLTPLQGGERKEERREKERAVERKREERRGEGRRLDGEER